MMDIQVRFVRHKLQFTELIFIILFSPHYFPCSGKDQESQLLMEGSLAGFYSKLEESGWLRHTRLLMLASVVAAEKLHFEGTSVLVHCSDGWYAQITFSMSFLLWSHFG